MHIPIGMTYSGVGSVYTAVAVIGIVSAFFVAYWLFKKEPLVAAADVEETRVS